MYLCYLVPLCANSLPCCRHGWGTYSLPPLLLMCATALKAEPLSSDKNLKAEGGQMPSTRRRRRSKSEHSTQPPTNATTQLLLSLAGLLVLSCLVTFAAGQRTPTPTPSPAASRFSGETPAPRGGGNGGDGGRGGGGGDDDGDLSEVCEADGGSADYSEVLT